jgi:hypothetical protein
MKMFTNTLSILIIMLIYSIMFFMVVLNAVNPLF